MSKIKSPSEKKRLSLALDRRNTYGENDKASRKAIPLSKARSHRNERRSVLIALAEAPSVPDENVEIVEAKARSVARLKKVSAFRKCPDEPLGKVLVDQAARRDKRNGRRRGMAHDA
jgi:hypothetical protein